DGGRDARILWRLGLVMLNQGLSCKPDHERLNVVLPSKSRLTQTIAWTPIRLGNEPLIDVAEHEGEVGVPDCARPAAGRAGKQVRHKVVGDLSAGRGRDHAGLVNARGAIGGLLREEANSGSRGRVRAPDVVLIDPVRKVPVTKDGPVVRDHVGVAVDRLRILRASIPGRRPRIIAYAVENALAVVVRRA